MLWLFRLNAVQLVSTFHELVVRLNQTVVLRVVIAQNHARIDHIALEVDSLGPQRQFVAARIAVEPALVKVVARSRRDKRCRSSSRSGTSCHPIG